MNKDKERLSELTPFPSSSDKRRASTGRGETDDEAAVQALGKDSVTGFYVI